MDLVVEITMVFITTLTFLLILLVYLFVIAVKRSGLHLHQAEMLANDTRCLTKMLDRYREMNNKLKCGLITARFRGARIILRGLNKDEIEFPDWFWVV